MSEVITFDKESIEDWEKVLVSTRELMANPFCDHLMFMNLLDKELEAEQNIKRLKKK